MTSSFVVPSILRGVGVGESPAKARGLQKFIGKIQMGKFYE